MSFQIRLRNCYYVFFLGIFLYVGIVGRSFAGSSKYLPMIIGIVGVIIVTLDAVTIAYGSRRRPVGSERVVAGEGDEVAVGALTVSDIATEHSAAYFREVGGFVAWVAGYVALIVLLGFTLATAVFLLSYLRLSAKWGYFATVVGVVVTVGLLAVLSSTFGIDWPDGVFSSL